MLANKIGIVIIEALHILKEPAFSKDIVEKVAFLLRISKESVHDAVQRSLEGGVRYGYILKRRNKYCFKMGSKAFKDLDSSSCNLKKQPYSKITIVNLENTESFMHESKNTIRTLFKSRKRMRSSGGDLSLENSIQRFKSKASVKLTINSLPASMIATEHRPRKTIKNFNVINK